MLLYISVCVLTFVCFHWHDFYGHLVPRPQYRLGAARLLSTQAWLDMIEKESDVRAAEGDKDTLGTSLLGW